MKTIIDISIENHHTFGADSVNTSSLITVQSLMPSMRVDDSNKPQRFHEVGTDFFQTTPQGLREMAAHLLKVAELGESEAKKLQVYMESQKDAAK